MLIEVQLNQQLRGRWKKKLGYDELVYRVDSSGNKELAGYEHLKNFEVPEKFQKYVIKPLE